MTTQPSPATGDIRTTLGPAFFGFSLSAILYGITIRQAYQYYTTNVKDASRRKVIIAILCTLDSVNLVFSMWLIYSFILEKAGVTGVAENVVSGLKGLGTVQTFAILFVQGFYLSQIWTLSGLLLLRRSLTQAIQIFVIFIGVFAVVVTVIFLNELRKIQTVSSFPNGFEYYIYLGLGATALIDCAIAAAMCVILYKSGKGTTTRSESVLETLVQYFVGTGLLTSFAAIMGIVLYVAQPQSLLYLGIEFSVTRLYTNSMLAMFNAREQLRARLTESDPRPPSDVYFEEPSPLNPLNPLNRHPSHPISLLAPTPYPYYPGQETKYECDCTMQGGEEQGPVSRCTV